MSNNIYFISVFNLCLIYITISKTIENESYQSKLQNSNENVKIFDSLYEKKSLYNDNDQQKHTLIEFKNSDPYSFNVTVMNKTKDYLRKLNDKRFYFQTEENLETNKTFQEILNKFVQNKTYFMDYKQVYGLRYQPNFLSKSLTKQNSFNTTPNDIIFISPTDSYIINVTQPIEQNLITEKDKLEEDTIENLDDKKNIMRPSRVQTTLDLITKRIKKLFKLDHNELTDEISTELTSPAKRFLEIFNVIRFKNLPCISNQKPLRQLNGTCYNKVECDRLGGLALDQCANGFGVCCVFKLRCGDSTSQNVSYFENPGYPMPFKEMFSCVVVIELSQGVKQILLDFIIFEIKPPISGTCKEDLFFIAGHNINQKVPTICGINSGQHMYINVDNAADKKIYLSLITNSVDLRIFSIRITQLRENLAPQYCLQFFTNISGYVQTFNYEDNAKVVVLRRPSYFNDLNYAICIQRASGYCTITYTNEINGLEYDMQLINVDEDGVNVISDNQAGAEVYNCADDYISINSIRLCGDKLNDGGIIEDFTKNSPVTDFSAGPIILPVKTNDQVVGRGFKLFYNQNLCIKNVLNKVLIN